MVFHSLNYWL